MSTTTEEINNRAYYSELARSMKKFVEEKVFEATAPLKDEILTLKKDVNKLLQSRSAADRHFAAIERKIGGSERP